MGGDGARGVAVCTGARCVKRLELEMELDERVVWVGFRACELCGRGVRSIMRARVRFACLCANQ
jgi:hypothetical protein